MSSLLNFFEKQDSNPRSSSVEASIELALLRWITGHTAGKAPEEHTDPIIGDDRGTVTFGCDRGTYFYGRCQLFEKRNVLNMFSISIQMFH